MTVDFRTAKIIDGDFLREEDYSDGEGCHNQEDSWIQFRLDGYDVDFLVEFSQEIEGYWYGDDGDYWTPGSYDYELTKEEVHILATKIDDVEIEMCPELELILLKLVDAEIQKPREKRSILIAQPAVNI